MLKSEAKRRKAVLFLGLVSDLELLALVFGMRPGDGHSPLSSTGNKLAYFLVQQSVD